MDGRDSWPAADRDGPRDECGVFAVHAPGPEIGWLTYFALRALQHRGQESAGIATVKAGRIRLVRGQGLVDEVFDEPRLAAVTGGQLALGHVRYSTAGPSTLANAQPVLRQGQQDRHRIALGHNGNLINSAALRERLRAGGVRLHSSSDTEVIAALIASDTAASVEQAVANTMAVIEGAYSAVLLAPDRLVAFRDPAGLRPLSLGLLDGRFCVASETCAFDVIGARFVRDVAPGEIVSVSTAGLTSQQATAPRPALCVFEYIYFARPDSQLGGQIVQPVRNRMGRLLATEAPAEADVVVPVPDSGRPAARGFSQASGLALEEALVMDRYTGRTFIQPGQRVRRHRLRLKFNTVPGLVDGKRIVLVDDSIVRGNTTRRIVAMLRQAGAAQVHLRISAPPIRHPCAFGIDLPTREELIAHRRTESDVAAELGADSLHHLSLAGLYSAIRGIRDKHCDGCFTGEYPILLPPGTAGSGHR